MQDKITDVLEILSRLRLKAIKLSIDYFGTGYTSMQQLKNLPFTELEIDRAFVFGACNNRRSESNLRVQCVISKKLNLKIVAEGAETQEYLDLVESLGCDLVQGYFFSKALRINNSYTF